MTIALRENGCNRDDGRASRGTNTIARMTQSIAARRCCDSGGKNIAAALAEAPQGEGSR